MEQVIINYSKNNCQVEINLTNKTLMVGVPNEDVVRYLKGIFTNKSRFVGRFINEALNVVNLMEQHVANKELEDFNHVNPQDFECSEFMAELVELYDKVEPYTYVEAFKLDNREFQALVFGSIDITEMIKELGHERIKTEGKLVNHKQFLPNGEFMGMKEYNNIYETHKVNGSKLGLEEDIYAIKCWCTSTNEEHWLWIDEQFKDEPLKAIASTFRIHENLIPHIKELKRQGDILLVEMNEGQEDLKPEGEIIPLTANQYFDLLTAQS